MTLCVRRMTSVIYRALYNSVERNKGRTDNIANSQCECSSCLSHNRQSFLTSSSAVLHCTTPSCRLASEPHQIIVQTRGCCTHHAHEFPRVSGHSTHCWAFSQCTGTKDSLVVKAANSFTKSFCRRSSKNLDWSSFK